MASIDGIAPTTELDAVNAMLGAVGQAPIEDLDGATATDVVMAVNILRGAVREILTAGWRFNTLLGLELAPYDSMDWVDASETVTPINIFTPPAQFSCVRITPARVSEMFGVDFVQMPPMKYGDGETDVVLFDRTMNRDGFDAEKFPALYIDCVRFMDFEQMPEEARKYAEVRSARQFAARVVGSAELSGFVAEDEMIALRSLKRAHGEEEDYNLFQTVDVHDALGGRPNSTGALLRNTARGPWA